MQSSPPQHAWDPPSPATTKYSLDLTALEPDSRSGASTPLPGQEIDKVLSEDIDGPSDFTLNMEKWMRAGGASVRRPSMMRERLGSVKESKDEHYRGDVMAAKDTQDQDVKDKVENSQEDHGAEDDSLSLGEPDAEQQTPRADGSNPLHQPTVEDYYSELNILGATPVQTRSASNSKQETQSATKEAQRPVGGMSSPTLSPIRAPVPTRRSTSSAYSTDFTSLDQQIQELTARCQQLEQLNASMNEKLDAERRLREAENQALKVKLTEAARREKDLTEMKASSQTHRDDFRKQFDELKERLRQRDAQQTTHEQELQRLKDNHALEIQKLRDQLDTANGEHEEEILAMELELELQRRGRADFEEMSRTTREELDERRTEVEKMKMELQQGEELREQIKEQLRLAKMEHEKLRSTIPPPPTTEKKTIENLQRQLKEAKQQLRDEKAATKRLESTLPSADDANDELELLRAQLNEATIERDNLQDRLAAEKEDKEDLQERVEEMDNVNKLVDSKIAETIKKREAHWRAKMAEMQEEREIMGKALLRCWGKLEGGKTYPDGRQEYFFKFPPPQEVLKEKKRDRLKENRREKVKDVNVKDVDIVREGKKGSVRFAL